MQKAPDVVTHADFFAMGQYTPHPESPGISWRRCGTVCLFFFFMAQPGMGPLSYCPSRSIPRRNWSHPTIKNADHGVHIPLALCVHPAAAPVWRGALRQTRGPDPGTGSPSAGFSRQEEIFAVLQRLRDILRPCVSTPMAHKAQFSLRETRWMTRAVFTWEQSWVCSSSIVPLIHAGWGRRGT